MLYVRTFVAPSAIQGLGLFADQDIAAGTLLWSFTPGFDQRFTREMVLAFPPEIQMYLVKYGWLSKKSNLYCYATDNGKYFNHSETPNVKSVYTDTDEESIVLALRDIAKGEELTDNYASFEDINNENNVLFGLAKQHACTDDIAYV